MKQYFRNVLAFVGAIFIGVLVNMGIIMISGSIIPPPEGADVTSTEGLRATIHLFQPKNFVLPFLAHALGTIIGAFVAYKVVSDNHMNWALAIGAFFFVGGAINVYTLPSPMWFNLLDLIGAYFPMAFLGGILARKF
jgi:hypothetical protein